MNLRNGLSNDGRSFTAHIFEGFGKGEDLSQIKLDTDDRIGAILDIEATGLDKKQDEIIEVAVRKFIFNSKNGKIKSIGQTYTALQQSTKPLSDIIIKITGLTDKKLAGHKINWQEFDQYIDDVSLIIAHNAQFDRAFIDRYSKESTKTIWGCSWYHVPWRDYFPVQSQEGLALIHGFFYEGHRALADVDALLKLIQMSATDNGDTYFKTIMEESNKPTYWVFAENAKRDKKDILKQRRYWWDTDKRCWKKRFSSITDVNLEMGFLGSEIYPSKNLAKVETVRPVENFKL